MRCAECLLRIHDHAEECPHCGMSLERLKPSYEGIRLEINDGVHDVAGALGKATRKQLGAAVLECESQFLGVNVAISFIALRDEQTVETYGFWLLNSSKFLHGRMEQPELVDGHGRVILSIDVEGKSAGLSYGYYFDGYVSERENFDVLSAGHASLLEGDLVAGCEQILDALRGLLKRAVLRARKGARR